MIPSRKPGLAERVIEGKTYVIDPASSTLHEIDETGTFIWRAIDGTRSHAQLTQLVTKEYDVTETEARKDIDEFLVALKKQGLLKSNSVER